MRITNNFLRVCFTGLLFFLLFIFAGCVNQKGEKSQTTTKGYEVIDDQNTVVKLSCKPQRIMTTHFHLDNLLLGVVPEERVVAISDSFDDEVASYSEPRQFTKPKRYHWTIPFEQTIVFKPDLIIARPTTGEEKIKSYRDMGIPVYVSDLPSSVEDVKQKITTIAAVCGEPEHGKRLNEKINQVLRQINEKISRDKQFSKSFVLVCKTNPKYGGKGCFFDNLCQLAKVRNGIADMGINNGQLIGMEVMVKSDPDYFLLSKGRKQKYEEEKKYKNEFLSNPALRDLHAIKEKNVLFIEEKYLYSNNQNCIWAIKKLVNIAYGNILPKEKEVFLKGY